MHVSPRILSIIIWVTLITPIINMVNTKTEHKSPFKQEISDVSIRQSRLGHRLQLFFPLMLSVANRLGSLISLMMIGVGGIIALVTFSNLALLASLGTLALVIHEHIVTKQKPEIYVVPSATSTYKFPNLFPTNLHNGMFKKSLTNKKLYY